MTAALLLDHMDDSVTGWWLGRESWMFHRWYFEIYGQPTERGEYSHLLRQLRGKRDPEVVVAGVFRLAMRDGSPILVTGTRGAIARLLTVLPPDWQIGDPVLWQRDPHHVRHAPKRKPTLPRVEDASPPALASQPVPAAVTNNSELAAKILASKS